MPPPASRPPKSKISPPHSPPGHAEPLVHVCPPLAPPTHVAGSHEPPGQSPASLHGSPVSVPASHAEKIRLRRAMRRIVCGASLEPNRVSTPGGEVASCCGSKIGASTAPEGVSDERKLGPGSSNGATSAARSRRGTGTSSLRTKMPCQLNGK